VKWVQSKRLKPFLTLMGIIAWRLFWLTHINRQMPEAPYSTILADHEWKALYTTIHRSPTIPATVPSVRQAVRCIAQLGGFLHRSTPSQLQPSSLDGWSYVLCLAVVEC